jgi:hypothetical protein
VSICIIHLFRKDSYPFCFLALVALLKEKDAPVRKAAADAISLLYNY